MYPLSYLALLNNFKDGAWFDPSTDEQIAQMVALLDIKPGEKIADLGAGDGRVVMAMAKQGADAYGLEKDRKLVEKANVEIAKVGLKKNAHMVKVSFWGEDLSIYDKIVLYQFKTVMPRLEQKLAQELRDGTIVVSNTWKFPHWKPVKEVKNVLLYIKDNQYL